LLDFINEEFGETIEESENLVEQGLINYGLLWTIFRPGITLYAPVFGQPRAFTLESYQYVCGQDPGFMLTVKYVDFDGEVSPGSSGVLMKSNSPPTVFDS
jgi:hypothetical protein